MPSPFAGLSQSWLDPPWQCCTALGIKKKGRIYIELKSYDTVSQKLMIQYHKSGCVMYTIVFFFSTIFSLFSTPHQAQPSTLNPQP